MPRRIRMTSSGPMLATCILALSTVLSTPAWAPHVAGHRLRIVVPFTAGGPTDAVARLVAERMKPLVNYQIIVENRVGAAGRIGAVEVRNAEPDGGTVLFATTTLMTVNPSLFRNLEYDPVKDFKPVTQVGTLDYGIAVGANVPAKSLREFVAFAKANPGQAYATPGSGTLPHLLGTVFAQTAGIKLAHVPFRGSAPAIADVIAGQIPMIFASTSELTALPGAGGVRVLALASKGRSPLLPDVPTFREAGFDLEAAGWYGVFAPAGTPAGMVESLSKQIAAAVQGPEAREQLAKFGLRATGTTPGQLAEIQTADVKFWATAISAAGINAGDRL